MSNTKKMVKMNEINTQNVENQSINNIKINHKFTQRNNFFVVIARFYNWNSTIVGKYTDKQIAIKCANDYLNIINQFGTGNSHRITEIVIDGSSIKNVTSKIK